MPVSLTLPSPLISSGPGYATTINVAIQAAADATHTGGANGDKWTSASLGIDAPVAWNGYSITQLKSTNYTQQASHSTANSLYVKTDGTLHFVNGSGTDIAITSGGGLNVAALIASIWPQLLVSTNIAISASDVYSHYKVDVTSGAKTITLPSAAAVGAGRFYFFTDHVGGAATNNITLQRAGSDTIFGVASYAIASDYGSVGVISDGVSSWSIVGGSVASQTLDTTLRSLADLTIRAADKSSAGEGNHITVRGGANSGAGTDGGVKLNVDSSTMVQVTEVASGRRVVSLCKTNSVTTSELPANTGDGVVYLANAATAPTDSPIDGVLVYSTGGVFSIRNDNAVASRWSFPGNLTTTSPTNGSASAPPAQPDGYLTITHNGTTYKLAAYRGV